MAIGYVIVGLSSDCCLGFWFPIICKNCKLKNYKTTFGRCKYTVKQSSCQHQIVCIKCTEGMHCRNECLMYSDFPCVFKFAQISFFPQALWSSLYASMNMSKEHVERICVVNLIDGCKMDKF